MAALGVGLALLGGCQREQPQPPASQPSPPPPRHLPELEFPIELRQAHPEVSAFLDEFPSTCLAGDYLGYRKLVSRMFEPESRERFEAIYQAIERVRVESIEEVRFGRLPPPVYRVVSLVELSPERRVKLRQAHKEVAILVFKEGGQWRMAPAPAALQPSQKKPPAGAPASAPTSAPTSAPASAPSFPWDAEGDY